MLVKIAEVKVNKDRDHYDTLIEAIKKAGFTVVLDYDYTGEKMYSISKEREE